MSKNTNFEEEIIFFDAEIIEDDDNEDIPMGVLVNAPANDEPAQNEASDEPAEEIVADSAPAEESVQEDIPAEEPAEDEAIAEEPIVDEAPAVTADVAPADEPAPKKAPQRKPQTEAKPKTASAQKKPVNEADIWGVAVINTKKPKAEKPVEEPKAEEKKPAPRKKPAPKAEPQEEAQKPAPKKAPQRKPQAEAKVDTTTAPKAEPKAKATTTPKNTKKTSEEEPKVAKETKAPEETIIQEGTREYHGKFVIKKTDKGHFVYKLFAYGNKCVAIGAQAYEGLSGVKGGIASVAKIAGTAPIENQTLKSYETLKFPKWEIYADKKGEFRLRLYASNGNLVATTNDGYLSVQAAKKGIESVAKAVDGAAIVRNDNAW